MYRQSEKNLLSSNISSMVNFGLLAAEIVSLVWGTPANFNGFRILAALLHGTLVVGVSQTAEFNRGRHLYSAGRPSGWALAHISSMHMSCAWGQKAPTSCLSRKQILWSVTTAAVRFSITTQIGSTYIFETMIDSVEIPTANLEFSIATSSKEVLPNDCDNVFNVTTSNLRCTAATW